MPVPMEHPASTATPCTVAYYYIRGDLTCFTAVCSEAIPKAPYQLAVLRLEQALDQESLLLKGIVWRPLQRLRDDGGTFPLRSTADR